MWNLFNKNLNMLKESGDNWKLRSKTIPLNVLKFFLNNYYATFGVHGKIGV